MQERTQEEMFPDPAVRVARSSLLFMWTWAQETDLYVKDDWIDLSNRLLRDQEHPESVLTAAELLYESCQDENWPSLLN